MEEEQKEAVVGDDGVHQPFQEGACPCGAPIEKGVCSDPGCDKRAMIRASTKRKEAMKRRMEDGTYQIREKIGRF